MRRSRRLNEFTRFAKSHAKGMRNPSTGNPDAVQVSVRGQRDTDGLYIVRRDHWPTDILVPSSPRDAMIPFPRRMAMGYEDGNDQKPVLYWLQRAKPQLGPLGARPNFYAAWWRYGVRMAYRFFASLWDDTTEPESDIVFSPTGLTGAGSIVRADADGVVYWAAGDNLNTLDLATDGPTGTPTVTDLGGEITSLCLGELSGRSYCTVQEYVIVSDTDYEDGYAAAVALLTPGSAFPDAYPFTQGGTDCTSESGYHAEDFVSYYLGGDYAPDPGESTDWQEGWTDGFTAFYISEYNEGYESEGCTVP